MPKETAAEPVLSLSKGWQHPPKKNTNMHRAQRKGFKRVRMEARQKRHQLDGDRRVGRHVDPLTIQAFSWKRPGLTIIDRKPRAEAASASAS
ncbi:MAG: hypothetical protein A2W28_09540 [Gammaproteobacteria bacterium RBG_16_51_14]|nr:MAG: hypothetical protein A2W28_09540 [Gammaproteobacteria bacterium RBG_16_51_14]